MKNLHLINKFIILLKNVGFFWEMDIHEIRDYFRVLAIQKDKLAVYSMFLSTHQRYLYIS